MKIDYKNSINITLILIIITLVSFILISNNFQKKIESLKVEQHNDQQLVIAKQSSATLRDFFENIRLLLISISSTSRAESVSLESIKKDIHLGYVDSITYILKTDQKGLVLEVSDIKFNKIINTDISDSVIFDIPKLTKSFAISEIKNSLGLERSIIISTPYFEEKKSENSDLVFAGIIGAVIDIDEIESIFNKIKIGTSGYIWITNGKGELITKPIESWKNIQSDENYYEWIKANFPQNSDIVNKIIVEESGTIIEDWDFYGKTITAFNHVVIGSEIWIIGVTTPYSALLSEITILQSRMTYFMLSMLGILSISFIFLLHILKTQEKTVKKLERAELTLEKLGIKSNKEISTNGNKDIHLSPNNIYILKEKSANSHIEIFISMLNKGYSGLGVTRKNPSILKNKFGLEKTPFLWLRKQKDKNDKLSIINVKDLLKIVNDFISESNKSIIMIERFDYIISQNGFEKAIKFLHNLNDSVMQNDSLIIISINPKTLNEKDMNLIDEECTDISTIIRKDKPKIPKDLHDILKYIWQMSLDGRAVYFKTISKKFNITKPTTKKKVTELKNYNFIKIDKHGRVKSISLTDKGLEFIEEK